MSGTSRPQPPRPRVPPHNPEAEQSLLGALLLDQGGAALEAATAVGVKPDDFWRPAHGHIYEAIASLCRRGEPADPVTVSEELSRAGVLDDIGGHAAIVALQADTPSISRARGYAEIVVQAASARELVRVGEAFLESSYASDFDGVRTLVERAAVTMNGHGRASRRVITLRASEVVPAPVRWAWEGRVPIGAVTLVVGREGAGKGIWAAHAAARWTRGQWDGDLREQPAVVAIASVEDDHSLALVPRLSAAGADLQRVRFLTLSDEHHDGLRFPEDIAQVRDRLAEVDARVLIVDVPTAFVGAGVDTHKDADVRRGFMTPFGAMAAELGLALVILHHLNRAPSLAVLDRIAGSLGVSRSARAVLAVTEHPENPSERVIALVKANLGQLDVPATKFRIEGAEVPTPTGPAKTGKLVSLGEEPGITARNMLMVRDAEELSSLDEAKVWLESFLGGDPVESSACKKAAEEEGFSTKTLRRARESLGVVIDRKGFGPEQISVWSLPAKASPPGDSE